MKPNAHAGCGQTALLVGQHLPRKRYAPYPACAAGLKVQLMQTASITAAPAPQQFTAPYPPLALVNKPNLTTAELAYYLDRRPQTLRGWACNEDGPLRPKRIGGILAWPTADAKVLAGVA